MNEWDIVYQRQLGHHKSEALVKAIDTLAFLEREHHITTSSLPSVVQACRTFVEATLNGGMVYLSFLLLVWRISLINIESLIFLIKDACKKFN